MVRENRIVYSLGLAEMIRLPMIGDMADAAAGLSDEDRALLCYKDDDGEPVISATSSKQQVGAYLRALGNLVTGMSEKHMTRDCNGLLAVATTIDNVVVEALDRYNLLDPPPQPAESKYEKRTQVEWAQLADSMVRNRIAEIKQILSNQPSGGCGSSSDDGEPVSAADEINRPLLDTEKQSWKQLLPILRKMMKPWKKRYEKKGFKKPFAHPKCIRAFNNTIRRALGMSEAAAFKVGSLNMLMNSYDRRRFSSSSSRRQQNDDDDDDDNE